MNARCECCSRPPTCRMPLDSMKGMKGNQTAWFDYILPTLEVLDVLQKMTDLSKLYPIFFCSSQFNHSQTSRSQLFWGEWQLCTNLNTQVVTRFRVLNEENWLSGMTGLCSMSEEWKLTLSSQDGPGWRWIADNLGCSDGSRQSQLGPFHHSADCLYNLHDSSCWEQWAPWCWRFCFLFAFQNISGYHLASLELWYCPIKHRDCENQS